MGRYACTLFCSAALWVVGADPALAQESDAPAPADTASAAVDDGSIVVTARRREERCSRALVRSIVVYV